MKKKLFLILKIMLILFILSFSVYLEVVINKLGILPNKYYYAFLALLVFLNIVGAVCLFLKNKFFRIISVLVYIILILISFIGIKYGEDTNDFLDEAFNNYEVEKRTFHIVVRSDSSYNSLSDLEGKDISYYTFYNDTDKIISEIEQNIINPDIRPHDDLYDAFINFLTKNLTALVIDDGYLDVLSENYDNLDTRLRILYTFEIESKVLDEQEIPSESVNDRISIDKENSFNIYLSGSDSRSATIYNKTRSDVNMVITINPLTKTILLTSIPRDYYVQVHGQTGLKDKLTHSGIYGLNISKETVADLFGIDMDYAIKVGFNSVVSVVDLVGGIDIYSDVSYPINSRGCVFNPGNNQVDGKCALVFARERHAYAGGDRHRILNQQQVLGAVMKKVMADKSILLKYDELLSSLSKLYITDIPRDVITSMIKLQLNDMSSWKILNQSVDGTGSMQHTHVTPNSNLYVMIPNEDTVLQAELKIKEVMEAKK